MATPKFDRIHIEFAGRINDPVDSANAAGKIIISADRRSNYINKAMFKLMDDMWSSVGGDKDVFLKLFPELMDFRTIAFDANGEYTLVSPNLDKYCLVGVFFTANSKAAEIKPASQYQIIKSGKIKQLQGSENRPICVDLNAKICAFPVATYKSTGALITIIKAPLKTDGSFITQGGDVDSPFHDMWNSKIAEIAEQLWRIDAGEV